MTEAERKRTGRFAGVVTARPRLVLLLALLFTVLAVVGGGGVADRLSGGGWQDPGSESAFAGESLDEHFPGSRPNLLLLVDTGISGGVDDPAAVAEARALAGRLADRTGVVGVGSYWAAEPGSPQAAALRSKDGREAVVAARITGDESRVAEVYEGLAPEFRGQHGPLEVRLGGEAAVRDELQTTIREDLLRAELIALPVTLVLLVIVFGSAVAALLPLGVGIIAVLGTNAVLRVITQFTDVSVFAQNLTTALGLGLAVDYALFIVRRFREEVAAGADPRTAIGTTLRTAGRTVLFSALTVAVSLSAMLLFPQFFLRSFAYAGIAVVLLAAAAALIVLPAALLLLGRRVDAWRLLPARRGAGGGGWARLARTVMRRAPLFALATTAGLVLLGLPFLRVEFGTADDRQLPATAEAHVVQQHIREGFPGTPGGTLDVFVDGGGATDAALADYRRQVAGLPGVASVAVPVRGPDGTALLTVTGEGEAVDADSRELVRDIRGLTPPFDASVTGRAAELVDSTDAIAEVLPRAGLLVIGVTLVLLFLLTGSVLVPVLAVALNALSLTAMFGAMVWIFQDGHLSGPLGFTPTGSVETTLPVLMFCVAFGLSMDYGVFLLSRIKEEYDRTGSHRDSVVFGLSRTGGLITAAAVILAVVMVAIGSSRIANTKMLGLGLALAVLMDAMVVRGLLVPAVLRLTGRATWWAPGPLARLHARFGLSEGAPAASGPAADAGREKKPERDLSGIPG
ncbi:Trehalose monomycolate exporter MmpL3 [Streptomyces sp. RB5]|uniref:Trehalose monomycolate exporter MmpL3 n=1 Tax=Streptomyces smaragdinus TaxID=2585196 RepID=A0A7K0CU33_9ACTN|nr:MMPL family transporter [Streptomyces smaragdinus]MQY16492.1 Trehalose monomycolate exporter MmpL3 [Streptomyces smaragdinus]